MAQLDGKSRERGGGRRGALISSSSQAEPAETKVPDEAEQDVGGAEGEEGEEERHFLTEIVLDGADGEPLNAAHSAQQLQPNAVHSANDVKEEVERIFDTGYFQSVQPELLHTRDGAKLVISCTQNARLNGIAVKGAHCLPQSASRSAFDGQILNTLNFKRVSEGIERINAWYEQRGLLGQVSDVSVDERNCLVVQVSEVRVASIGIRAIDKESGESAPRRITRDDAILRHVGTRTGDVYSLKQARQDIDSVYAMGVFDDVSMKPQPDPEDQTKMHLTLDVAESKPGGFSAGGGLSTKSMTDGPLAGFVGNCSYTHHNLFGLNQHLTASVEAGHIDSVFKVSHHDPWIRNDKRKTSRTVTLQSTRSSASAIHSAAPSDAGDRNATGANNEAVANGGAVHAHAAQNNDAGEAAGGGLTVRRLMASLEYSRKFASVLSGSIGLSAQQAGVRDDGGSRRSADAYGAQLTHTGNFNDQMAIVSSRLAYGMIGHPASGSISLEQAVPVVRPMLQFTRVQLKQETHNDIGALKLQTSFRGGRMMGDLPPHDAFALGGTDSIRGYEEGSVGTGRQFLSSSMELHVPIKHPVEAAVFADMGTDLGTGVEVPGDPAGKRGKPGKGYGYGVGLRLDSPVGPLRLEYALNDSGTGRFHFGVGRGGG